LREALKDAEAVLAKRPDFFQVLNEYGAVLMQLGRHDEAETAFRKALEIRPGFAPAMQNLMLTAHYIPGMTLERLAEYHREFSESTKAHKPLMNNNFQQSRDPGRTLRIGFVSCDFRRHPIGYFVAPLLQNLNKDEIQTTCYSDNPSNDDMTGHVRAGADHWVDIRQLTHRGLAERILHDKIDILFDMNGHTGLSRLLAFAMKPAPIQITWAGYVGTTGIAEMDYIVSDRFHIPEDEEKYYVEEVLRISDCNFVVRPPDFAPEVKPLPVHKNGYITLGTFSIPTKINQEIVSVWCRIMDQLPNSRMMLKYRAIDDPANKERIEKLFQAGGIEPGRLMLYGATPHVDLLDHYNKIDIALDPAPYSGGLTTCEALWMGTPVITCPGSIFASRHSQSILSCVGLTDTVAADFDHYVDIATALANDRDRLAEVSAGLRQKMTESPLVDGAAFASRFSAAMRTIWTDWCHKN
jgi:predicted O-linked N-acetylglucosamine transferase (SPINDLY family)